MMQPNPPAIASSIRPVGVLGLTWVALWSWVLIACTSVAPPNVPVLLAATDSVEEVATLADIALAIDSTTADGEAELTECPAPGGSRCPCADNTECNSGLCIDYAEGKRCAVPCTTDGACLPTEGCVQSTTGGDVAQFCAPRFAAMCSPCVSQEDCRAGIYAGSPGCYPFGNNGSLCSVPCSTPADCPSGYSCAVDLGHCVPAGAACGCSAWAVSHGASTNCVKSNEFGSCTAKRECLAVGILPACSATSAFAEECNGLDDNCNGLTDDGAEPTCADGNACTKDFCAGGTCVHPSVNDCGDGFCADECAETSTNCPIDCHICPDGICQPGESPKNCPSDCCGTCGDGKCVGYECGEDKVGGSKHCPADCGTACGNQVCDKSESPSTCAADCAKQVCGNHVCEPNDGGPVKCPQDCAPTCGNCACEKGESPVDCPLDCGSCGDEICSLCAGQSESPAKCAVDCPVPPACKLWPGLCDDDSPCTADICIDGKGCVHPAQPGVACDDGSACTKGDICGNDGLCKGKGLECNDGNLCTTDGCNATGCLYAPVSGECSDGDACTVGDQCKAGACAAGPVNSCDDGNACTAGTCSGGKCEQLAAAGPCDDGNACTTADQCKNSACSAGQPVVCNDNQSCTADSCNSNGVCEYKAIAGPCDDKDACTVNDTCAAGKCVPGPAMNCVDTNECTDNNCVAGTCPWPANAAQCNDNDPCTTGDTCSDKKCTGTKVSCVDNNPCTIDGVCIQGTGCSFVNYVSLDTACPGGWCNGAGKCGTCTAAHPCAPQAPGTVACSSSNSCVCTPISKTTACGNKNCSTVSIGCGKTVSCGTCQSGKVCSGGFCATACGQCNAKMQKVCNDKGVECCDNVCQ